MNLRAHAPAQRGVHELMLLHARFSAEGGTHDHRLEMMPVAVNLQIRPVPAVTISGALQGPPEALRGMPLRLMAAGAEGLGRGAETATAIASL